MAITFRPTTGADIAQFIRWRYDSPYDAYDLDMPESEALEYFLNPATHCYSILLEASLIGYCTFGEDARVPGGDYSQPALDIGAAMEPGTTGQGTGATFVAAIVEFSIATFDAARLRVSIASNNDRALSVWKANRFGETARFDAPQPILGSTTFVVLERDA